MIAKRELRVLCLVVVSTLFGLMFAPRCSAQSQSQPAIQLVQADDSATERVQLEPLDQTAFALELSKLAEICDSVGMDEQAKISRHWLVPPRLDQQTLYLPVELPEPTAGSSPAEVGWHRRFATARQRYAQWLYAEAQRQAASGSELAAFQTVWQVLREDPTHADARRVLGPLANAAEIRPRMRRSTGPHADFGWPAGSYHRIQTPHFLLTTRASTRDSIAIARRLEAAHALWSQLFFDVWAPPGLLNEKLHGDSRQSWPLARQMEVFLLADRQDYLQTLGTGEANIGVSVGYYNPTERQSFFYPNENLEATFFHELTHQMFMESSNLTTVPDVGESGGVWLLEGVALYMESLREHGNYWTVGGFESPRLQTARYRALRDHYWPQWTEFSSGTIETWKADERIALYYAHAAGITHMLFYSPSNAPSARRATLDALTGIYAGRMGAGTDLISWLGSDDTAAKAAYEQRMTVRDEDIKLLHDRGISLVDLVLAGSHLHADTWQLLRTQLQLQWLDVSFSNARTEDLQWLSQLRSLERLSVEGTAVDGKLLGLLATLPKLVELDLSGCDIQDADLVQLIQCRALQTLWLTNTQITDASLQQLAKLPALTTCDVSGTKITPIAWQTFEQLHLSPSQ
ncbi:MAG: hypothetical protein R3C53_16735 [Pirellulaceae bacterium]